MSIALYCLNVGQANCLVIILPCPGKTDERAAIVIDVGVNGSELAKWLISIGVRNLPLILLTHNDRDHILGLESLVEAYRKRVGTVGFIVDRHPESIPYWLPIQHWVRSRVVQKVEVVSAQSGAAEPHGRLLISDPAVGYWLYCVYPTVFENLAAVVGAKSVGPKVRKAHNSTSAVIGLATSAKPRKWRIVFGGDLDLPGWHSLSDAGRLLRADVFVVPHHGGPRHETMCFGYTQLAKVVSPTFALISVGTNQSFGLPIPQMVEALREVGATVMCTQLTSQCVNKLGTLPNRSLLPIAQLTAPTHLAPSGTACAGTVAVVWSSSSRPSVLRLEEHQAAVDRLVGEKQQPLCRL